MRDVLIYAAAALCGFWGLSHIAKTRPVVDGFGPLSPDNRLVLTMEWLLEGIMLCFVAALVATVTAVCGEERAVALVDRLAAGLLVVMAVVSLFTGARASPLPYKLCAPIFGTAALLLVLGSAA